MNRDSIAHRMAARSAEQAANGLVLRYGIESPSHLADIERLAEFLGAKVFYLPIDGADGYTIRVDGRAHICVNSKLSRGAQRFAFGHEFGHFVLHDDVDQSFVCTREDMLDFYRTSSPERQANVFAAHVLMPASLFEGPANASKPSMKLAADLAGTFMTSLTSTAFRIVEVAHEPCALVVSTADRILWSVTSSTFPFFIDRRKGLSPSSFAHDLLQGESADSRLQEVDPDTWLYFDEVGGRSLFESSMLLGGYGKCLTMLWLRDRR